jgi:polysaccharide pyruvyl transferase WcaK-like protein
MAKLCLLGSNSGRNAGDAAILSSIIHNVQQAAPGTTFEVPVPRASDLTNRFDPEIVRPVPMMPWNLSLRFIGWTTLRSIARCDAVLITDGIIFDVKLLNPLFNFLILLAVVIPYARLLGKPVIGFLIGVGPLDSALGRRLARMVCNRCDALWVREAHSKALLESVGIPADRIEIYADAALVTPPPSPERIDAILAENALDKSDAPMFGLNVNSYVDQWLKASEGVNRESFTRSLAEAIDKLVDETDYQVVLVLTQIMDVTYARNVLAMTRNRERVAVLGNDRYSAEELMGVAGRMRYFAGMRVHSIILASAANVPCIGLAYAPKVRHFMELMGTPECTLELADFTPDRLLEHIRLMEKDDASRRQAYVSRVDELKAMAQAGYRQLAERFILNVTPRPQGESIMKTFLHKLLHRYLSLYIQPDDRLAEVDPPNTIIGSQYANYMAVNRPDDQLESLTEFKPDYVLLNGTLQRDGDIQGLLGKLRESTSPNTRVAILYYSTLWRPLLKLASALGLRSKLPESNWITREDLDNMLLISDYQLVRIESRVLFPLPIPGLSWLFNRILSALPGIRHLNLVNIAIVRPMPTDLPEAPSVSVVVAARNEEGHIEEIIQRTPKMGPDDELIFIEGGSSDDTWGAIQRFAEKYSTERTILTGQQDGKGKGDAVRKGFGMASKDILMILDADMTVPPEDLPRFYDAIRTGKGEFINGSRLVYPMEKEAMRFFNIIGNKFFAAAFSFVLGQQFRDTLCGTKVLTRKNYEKLARYRHVFGDFDPFGDFDLIFGAARMGLKIVEVPIRYRERRYGDTNISRWSHGVILLRMLCFAARRIKFL